MRKLFLIMVSWLLISNLALADISTANSLYKNGDFAGAVTQYEMQANRKPNHIVFFNLGNAYFKNGNIGKAIVNYERSLKYNYSSDAAFNLAYAKSKIVDKIDDNDSFYFQNSFQYFIQKYSTTCWNGLCVMLSIIAAFLIVWFYLSNTKNQRISLFIAVCIISILFVISLYFNCKRHDMISNNPFGIVTAMSSDLRSAPNAGSNTLSTLHEGLKVILLKEENGYYEVKLQNNVKAWLATKDVERI